MRRELRVNNIHVACTRPGWEARRDTDSFLVTGRKMRHVIMEAYQKMKKGITSGTNPV